MTVGGISTDNNQLRLKTADILIPRRCNRIFKNVMLSQASKIAYGKPLIDVTNYDAIKHHLTSLIVTSKRVHRSTLLTAAAPHRRRRTPLAASDVM